MHSVNTQSSVLTALFCRSSLVVPCCFLSCSHKLAFLDLEESLEANQKQSVYSRQMDLVQYYLPTFSFSFENACLKSMSHTHNSKLTSCLWRSKNFQTAAYSMWPFLKDLKEISLQRLFPKIIYEMLIFVAENAT